jgi:hypothetical protein
MPRGREELPVLAGRSHWLRKLGAARATAPYHIRIRTVLKGTTRQVQEFHRLNGARRRLGMLTAAATIVATGASVMLIGVAPAHATGSPAFLSLGDFRLTTSTSWRWTSPADLSTTPRP